jgi:serine/threonine-protein kinase
MPRAETSLAKHLEQHQPSLSIEEALPILRDIATALAALDGVIVHRDLKPSNVLLLDGSWCLADFGISRFADAATASDTRKNAKTWKFAAPEQWLGQRASTATDVYAFGVIAYLLLAGTPPFIGPGHDEFRHQHLNDDPPLLTSVPEKLRVLVDDCLLKAPNSRPAPSSIVSKLNTLHDLPIGRGSALLESVNRDAAKREDEHYRKATIDQEDQQWRQQLYTSGTRVFSRIIDALTEAIGNLASRAVFEGASARGSGAPGPLLLVKLEGAALGVAPPVLSEARWTTPFTVIAESAMSVNMPGGIGSYLGRSHSLWYCDAQHKDRFAWYEVAFCCANFGGSSAGIEPTSLAAKDVHVVFEPVMVTTQLARKFREIDPSDLAEFLDRWLEWFALAVRGQLQRPAMMPEERAEGSWRKGESR